MVRPRCASAALGTLLVLIASATVIAGCGGSGDESTATVTETTSKPASSSTSTTASTSTTGGEEGPPAADVQVTRLTGFTSPSGNIGCNIDRRSVRCDIDKRDWDPPARPASCPDQVDYGQGIELRAGSKAKFVCAGDTALGAGDPLPYGQSIAAGLLRCESAESGISCRDVETGRGFSLSIQSYDLR
jgi:hypothetical protein